MIERLNSKLSFKTWVRDGVQPPAFPCRSAAPDAHDPPAAAPRLLICASLLALAWAAAGCGTSANLAGLGVSLNVAQNGLAAGATFNAGTNSVTVGANYSQGTNSYSGTATIPVK